MARPAIVPTTEERAFRIDQLFFSTTDAEGIIHSGNRVFAHVSGWSAAELSGQPHNILRHPDMPRVVFKLLWDEIGAGRPIVAYVKNLSRTGAFYWVVASVIPIEHGYLSVRFKPSSSIFPVVEGLYAKLLTVEKEIEDAGGTRAQAMSASAEVLTGALKGLGYDSYKEFMLAFVPEELKSRDAGMERAGLHRDAARAEGEAKTDIALIGRDIAAIGVFLHAEFGQIGEFVSLGDTLVGKAEFVRELAKNVRLISQNVSISSRRRESAGRPLAVVGDTIRDLADRVGSLTVGLTERIHRLSGALRDQAFRISMARLQSQTAGAFVDEIRVPAEVGATTTDAPVGRICESISGLVQSLEAETGGLFKDYREIESTLGQVAAETGQLQDLLKTLGMVRMTGRVEVSRLKDPMEFEVLFDTIEKELASANAQLEELAVAMAAIRAATARGRAQEPDVNTRLTRARQAVHRVEQAEAV